MHLKNISYEEMKAINKGIRNCSTKMILDSFIDSDKYAMEIVIDDEESKEALNKYLAAKEGRTMKSYMHNVYTMFQHYIWDHKDEYDSKVKACMKKGKIYLYRVDKTLNFGDAAQRRGYK